MIKDLVVNLTVGDSRGDPGAFAVAVAAAFNAHVAAIAFAHDPIVPATLMGGVPADFIESTSFWTESARCTSFSSVRCCDSARRPSFSSVRCCDSMSCCICK